jgi:hypothetical protein
VGLRIGGHGWLEQPEEQHAAMARSAAVEAEGELVEVVVMPVVALPSKLRPRLPGLTPFFWLTTYQAATNQLTSGVQVLSKIVPAVTEVSRRHDAQRRSPLPIRQYFPPTRLQKRQTNPLPQRSRSKYVVSG